MRCSVDHESQDAIEFSSIRDSAKEFKFSNGWLQGFKSRHGIFVHVRQSEGGLAEISEEVQDRIEVVKALISGYDPEDVFNMDETSLFFQLEPNRTLSTRSISGKKKSKNSLSIALTENMTDTWKLPPFIVYKYSNPRAFSCRSIRRLENLGILWSANSKAWKTIKLFEKFLLDFERRLREAGRKSALLLVDNFTGHKIVSVQDQIRILRVEFLPPNVTAVYQPMDAGITRAFKTHYRKHLIHLKLDRLQTGQTSELVQAEDILPDFNSSSDLPDLNVSIANDGTRELHEALAQLEEITFDLGIVPNMTVNEYIDFENTHEIEDQLSLEELADFQALGDSELAEELDLDDNGEREPEPAVSISELYMACQTVQKFLEQSSKDTA
ncbi:hypothetical protein R1flu_015535 [Riccia fluitans]|uniref:Transposase n=1 Tax=Riccia fluitans TaxID=41844 RepID=A0ABD1YMC6_9MARC